MTAPDHWDATHTIIALELQAEGRPEAWINEVLGHHGFGPVDFPAAKQWLAETGGKCRCDHCGQTAPRAAGARQFSLPF